MTLTASRSVTFPPFVPTKMCEPAAIMRILQTIIECENLDVLEAELVQYCACRNTLIGTNTKENNFAFYKQVCKINQMLSGVTAQLKTAVMFSWNRVGQSYTVPMDAEGAVALFNIAALTKNDDAESTSVEACKYLSKAFEIVKLQPGVNLPIDEIEYLMRLVYAFFTESNIIHRLAAMGNQFEEIQQQVSIPVTVKPVVEPTVQTAAMPALPKMDGFPEAGPESVSPQEGELQLPMLPGFGESLTAPAQHSQPQSPQEAPMVEQQPIPEVPQELVVPTIIVKRPCDTVTFTPEMVGSKMLPFAEEFQQLSNIFLISLPRHMMNPFYNQMQQYISYKAGFYAQVARAMTAYAVASETPSISSWLIEDVCAFFPRQKLPVDPFFVAVRNYIIEIISSKKNTTLPYADAYNAAPCLDMKVEESNVLTFMPKGYQQMMQALYSQVSELLATRRQQIEVEQQTTQNLIQKVETRLQQSEMQLVSSVALATISQTQNLQEQIQTVLANQASLPAFYQQAQSIYKVLEDVSKADQNNKKQFGLRWDSSRAIPVIYAAMQDVVNIATALQKSKTDMAKLQDYKEEQYDQIFKLITVQDQILMGRKLDQLAPIRAAFQQLQFVQAQTFQAVMSQLPVIDSMDQMKQFIIKEGIQIQTNPQKAGQNLAAISQALTKVQCDKAQLAQFSKNLEALLQQIQTVDNETLQHGFNLSFSQLDQKCNELVEIVKIVQAGQKIIQETAAQISQTQADAQRLATEYTQQVQAQWQAFQTQHTNIVITLQK